MYNCHVHRNILKHKLDYYKLIIWAVSGSTLSPHTATLLTELSLSFLLALQTRTGTVTILNHAVLHLLPKSLLHNTNLYILSYLQRY